MAHRVQSIRDDGADILSALAEFGGEVRTAGAAAFRAWLERETENWGRVVRANGIKPD
jgi:hypothetical protein